jgi:hypothetical protein
MLLIWLSRGLPWGSAAMVVGASLLGRIWLSISSISKAMNVLFAMLYLLPFKRGFVGI